MAVPLLGMLLRGAMGSAVGTTRLAAMSGRAGRGAIAAGSGSSFPASMLATKAHARRVKEFSEPTRLRKFGEGIEKSTFWLGKFGLRTAALTAGSVVAATSMTRLATATNDSAISTLRTLSPAMAAIAARRDMFDMQMGATVGNATAGSADQLEKSRQRYGKSSLKARVFGQNVKNNFFANANHMLAGLFEFSEKIGLTKAITNYNSEIENGGRGKTLEDIDSILRKGIHNDPNLMNRRPNEKPGGRM